MNNQDLANAILERFPNGECDGMLIQSLTVQEFIWHLEELREPLSPPVPTLDELRYRLLRGRFHTLTNVAWARVLSDLGLAEQKPAYGPPADFDEIIDATMRQA